MPKARSRCRWAKARPSVSRGSYSTATQENVDLSDLSLETVVLKVYGYNGAYADYVRSFVCGGSRRGWPTRRALAFIGDETGDAILNDLSARGVYSCRRVPASSLFA